MTLTRAEQAKTSRAEQGGPPTEEEPPWITVVAPGDPVDNEPAPPSGRRVLAMMLLGAALISILVAVSGSVAASRLAEKESVNDAAKAAAVLADAVVQPALTDGLVTGDPKAFAAMDRAVREHVLGPSSVRVKIWTASGRVVYSDEPRLVGRVYPLGAEERSVFTTPVTRAEVSDLKAPENTYERGQGRLLEVYRPVWTPSGEPLLFETYARYDGVTSRATQLWRGFAGITISSLLALVVLMMPVVWGLLSRIRRAQDQRERLLERAIEASTDERRRIAGTLHDGVVQELAGASYVVSGAAVEAETKGQAELAHRLRTAAATVRNGIGSMRTLLVDIYPPTLATSGLAAALEDLAAGLQSLDVDVEVALAPEAERDLDPERARVIYRLAHECLLNCKRHSRAKRITIALVRDDGVVELEIADDGVGFDPARATAQHAEGHFGLRILADVAQAAGAELHLSTAPGRGTRWLVRLPVA